MRDIRNYYRITGFLAGGAWLGGAVCSLFDSLAVSFLGTVFAVIGTAVASFRVLWIVRTKMEGFDEMAEANLTKAKAFALSVLQACVLPIMIISLFNAAGRARIDIGAHTVALFALGIGELVTCMKFLSLERNGE